MLNDAQRAIVKSTVPLLETGGETLTRHFYRIMLSENPEVRPLFNQAHQASGDQPRALANSVLMYAKHIDRLEALGNLPAQIVHKHVSLQVKPEHYPIVGACLLRAIREVLGAEVATDAVIDAWGAAYQQLADLLIGAEEQTYAALEAAPGGWRGERAFRVTRKQAESSVITSFYLSPVDGGPVIAHQPGQYIGLCLVLDGQEQRRNYSLSSAANGSTLRISVKREPGGLVSQHLHEQVVPGDILQLFPPAGNFVLRDGDKDVITAKTEALSQVAMKLGEKMDLLKYSMNQLIDMLRPEDQMGIVVYSDNASVYQVSTPGDRKEILRNSIDKLKPKGMSAGGKGIQLGYKQVMENYDNSITNMVIVITDGAFNKESNNYQKTVRRYAKKGIILSVVGVQTTKKDALLMTEAATFGNGRFIAVQKLTDAHNNLKQEIRIATFRR